MNVAINLASPSEPVATSVSRRPGTIARVEIFSTFAAAEPDWRSLERAGALATPYQRYDFLECWHRHLGQRAGVQPFVVIGYDVEQKPVLLCPFGVVRHGPLRIASFLGGSHANFNIALWRRDLAAAVSRSDLTAVLAQIAAAGHGIDLLLLLNQPHAWDGVSNPFLLWPHQPSPSFGYRGALASDFDDLMRKRLGYAARKKMRRKMKALSEHGPVHFRRAATPEQARAVLDAFCAQKDKRMREFGVSNIFAVPGTREFIEELATARAQGRPPLIELYSLSAGDTIAATIGGMVGGTRFCAMFNSITSGPLAQQSPGDHLLSSLTQACCERGLTCFDLGVGDARYKHMFCNDTEPLFDTFLASTARGRLAAPAIRWAFDLKRLIKGSPLLWRMVQALRHVRGRNPFAP